MAGQLSPDGKWRWDGRQWVPTGGQGGPPRRSRRSFRRLQDRHDLVPTAIACSDVGHPQTGSAGSGGSNQNRHA